MPDDAPPERAARSTWGLTGLAVAGLTAFLSLFVMVGADCYWLVAMGDHIAGEGRVPDGIPFAAAPTDGWPNVLVLAQLWMAGLHGGGDAALPLTQIVVDAVALCLLAVGARRAGASDRATAGVLVLVGLGSLASLAIVRLQLFSLIPFALLLLLLRSDEEMPSRRIWLLPVLVVLWSNLHGAVLLGVTVAGAYLIFSRIRLRPVETCAVGVVTLLAMLVTPAGLRTVPYYLGVLENEAAQRGSGLWARPSLGNPFDVLMIVVGVLLLVSALRRRLLVWEYVVMLGLAVGTVTAARHGIWLLMAAAAPAAVSLTRRPLTPPVRVPARPVLVTVAASVVLACVLVLPRGDDVLPADPELVEEVVVASGDRVVLAPEPLAESLALAGLTVWAANPIDAFSARDQEAFLDFLEGDDGAAGAVEGSDAVVVEDGSDAADLMDSVDGFDTRPLTEGWTLYLRQDG